MGKKEDSFEMIIAVVVVVLLLKFVVGGLTQAWAEQQMPHSQIAVPGRVELADYLKR
jgi:hypothetical protein